MKYFISPNSITPIDDAILPRQLFDTLVMGGAVEYESWMGIELKKWLDNPHILFKHPDKKSHLFRRAKVTRYIHTIRFEEVLYYSSGMGDSPERDYVSVWNIFSNDGIIYANIHGLNNSIVNGILRKHLISDLLKDL